jgi:hypothetical protein
MNFAYTVSGAVSETDRLGCAVLHPTTTGAATLTVSAGGVSKTLSFTVGN